MPEISKMYKIILFINIVVCFVYGILFGFLWWFWLDFIDYTATSPFFAQFFGGFLIIGLIWYLRIILQKVPWEKAVWFIGFANTIMGMMIIYLAYEILFVFIEMTKTAQINSIVSISVTTTLLVVNIIFFFVESGKHK
jgi:hypothetical protein